MAWLAPSSAFAGKKLLRRFPTSTWCPFVNGLGDATGVSFPYLFVAPSSSATITFSADNLNGSGGPAAWNQQRLDNVVVVEASALANPGRPTEQSCYTNAIADVPKFALDYTVTPTSAVRFVDFFVGGPKAEWGLGDIDAVGRPANGAGATKPVFWINSLDPGDPDPDNHPFSARPCPNQLDQGVSTPCSDVDQSPGQPADGSLGLGRPIDGPTVSAHLKVNNLTAGVTYAVLAQWYMRNGDNDSPPNGTLTNLSIDAPGETAPVADVSITVDDENEAILVPASLFYVISVTNHSPTLLTNVRISDQVPTEIPDPVYQTLGSNGGSFEPSTGAWTGLALGPGDTAQIAMLGIAAADAQGPLLRYTADVQPPSGVIDPVPSNNIAADTDQLVFITELLDSFDDGQAHGWTLGTLGTPNLWRVASDCVPPSTPPYQLAFSQPSLCNYNTGGRVTGAATSGVVDLHRVSSATLTFDHYWETRAGTAFDLKQVQVSGDGGNNWTTVLQPSSAIPPAGIRKSESLDVSAFATNAFKVRFSFDSVNPAVDGSSGWYVDGVYLYGDGKIVQADLSVGIAVTGGQSTAVPGSPIQYVVTVRNDGSSGVTNASATVQLPPALLLVPPPLASLGSYDSGSWTSLNLSPGQSATLTLNGIVDSAARGSLVASAHVAPPGDMTDGTPANDSSLLSLTLAPRAALSITATDGTATVAPGQALAYSIVTKNQAGPSSVTAALLQDVVPPALTGVTWTCVATGGAICVPGGTGGLSTQFVDLPVGATATFTVTGTVSASATGPVVYSTSIMPPAGVADTDLTNNSASDSDTVVLPTNLSITKSHAQTTLVPGQAVTYTIVASNAGPNVANGATVTDTLPAFITSPTWTCVPSGGANCAGSGTGSLAALSVNLPVNGTVTFTVNGTISPSATGVLSNTATVALPAGMTDPATGNNSATDSGTLAPQADLAIAISDDQTTIIPGSVVTYTIGATNGGPSAVTGAQVQATAPGVLISLAWTCAATGGATCAPSGTGSVSQAVSLPVGGTATFTVTGILSAAAAGTVTYPVSLTPPGSVTDSASANNTASDVDTVALSADLSITKSHAPTTLVPGQAVTYTVAASNAGPSVANGAAVTDTLPAVITSPTWTCVGAGGASCTAGGTGSLAAQSVNLPVNGTVTFTVNGTISPAATVVSNTATVVVPSGMTDPSTGNNSATDNATLAPQANLAITVSDGQTTAVAGTPLTYTIVATNGGPSAVTGAQVQATAPGTLTGVVWTCAGAGGATCAPGGTGSVSQAVSLPVGGTATFTVTATLSAAATGTVTYPVSITPPVGVTDSTTGNNSASDVDTVSTPAIRLQFSAANYAVAESGGKATITVTRLGPTTGTDTVKYHVSDGTAVAGVNYGPTSGTLTFPPKTPKATFAVPVFTNALATGPLTALLSLSDPAGSGALGNPDTAVLTISDDDKGGVLRFGKAAYLVNEPGPYATVSVTRTGGAAAGVTVHYETIGGTAIPGVDYESQSDTLTFDARVSTRPISIRILDNGVVEGNRTFDLVLTNATGGATIGQPSQATVTIQADNPVFQFGAPNFKVSEGAAKATIPVTRSGPATGTDTVHYKTADGTAVQNVNYYPASGPLTFNPGVKTQSFPVNIKNDKVHEDGETVLLSLDTPSPGSALGQQSTAVLSITDNDPPGTIAFSAASYLVKETADTATITVKRKAGTAEAVTIHYDASGGTATPGADYKPVAGTLTFASSGPGETTQPFTIDILPNGALSGDKAVALTLANPQGGGLLGTPASAILTIQSVDPIAQFSAATYKVIESGKDPVITVKRSGPKTGNLTVRYDATGGTAMPGTDYAPVSGELTFGDTEVTKPFSVHLLHDPAVDGDETVILELSNPVGGGVGKLATAILTIATDDPSVAFSAPTYKVSESAQVAKVTVKRKGPLTHQATVDFDAAGGTASPGVDYQPVSGTLTFPTKSATQSFPVSILNDSLDQPGAISTVNLSLTNPDGVYIGVPPQATIQIGDNDAAGVVQFAASDYSVAETEGFATIAVVRAAGTASGVTVHYATSDGTGLDTKNYSATSGDLTFDQGQASRTITIPILDDGKNGNKTVHLTLSNPQGGGTLGARTAATLWIVDQDPPAPPDVVIDIVANNGSMSFLPNVATVHQGQTVAWHNLASPATSHTATQNGGTGFDTGLVAPGQVSAAVPITALGSLPYHCNVHPGMTGTLNVVP